jgi:protein-disulfide isomerase
MASRTKQKEEARARRVAEEQAHTERAQRNRRLQMLGGVVLVVIAIVAVAIAVSSGGGSPTTHVTADTGAATKADQPIFTLLNGIHQSGNTIGNANAPVTVTEFGDLECPICRDFATQGIENDLISKEVRTGKVKLAYRSLETATSGAPNPAIFGPQQAAAYAAGKQGKGWDYIELFYHQQGQEDTGYVTQKFLSNLAKQIPGLNYSQWLSDSHSQSLLSQVSSDESAATGKGYSATPTLVITGPKGQAQPIVGDPTNYSQLQAAITSVS